MRRPAGAGGQQQRDLAVYLLFHCEQSKEEEGWNKIWQIDMLLFSDVFRMTNDRTVTRLKVKYRYFWMPTWGEELWTQPMLKSIPHSCIHCLPDEAKSLVFTLTPASPWRYTRSQHYYKGHHSLSWSYVDRKWKSIVANKYFSNNAVTYCLQSESIHWNVGNQSMFQMW